MNTKQQKGKRGEDLAAEYLKAKGYAIVERNARFKVGELDIVASLGDTLVFAEVKARASNRFGYGREAVGADKQRRLTAAANMYLMRHPTSGTVRFDVLEVDLHTGGVTHLENAF